MPVHTNLKQYALLRTKMDSAVTGALRYYLNAANGTEQQQAFAYLDKAFQDIVDKVWAVGAKKIINCPPGYFACDGCCVPYQCIME